jgi:hypothetical protein
MSEERLPETLPELLEWIERYADSIFVLEEISPGQRETFALGSLPAKRALFHAFRWIRNGAIPVRVRSDEEVRAL